MRVPAEFSHPVSIGSGSFSTVLRVFQRKLQRHVVVKIIPVSGTDKADVVAREARVIASMRLSCVPRLYDIIQSRKNNLIVIEWVRGIELAALLRHALPKKVAFAIASNIVAALSHVHASNIAHRDLKPENIVVNGSGAVFFVDFGFSCSLPNAAPGPGVLQGTPAFMAPELWSCREAVDYKKADMFALGTILKNLLDESFPAFASVLTETDPVLRPADCTAFDALWRANVGDPADGQTLRNHVQPLISRYLAPLLIAASRQLHAEGRKEESYALLTESLREWPDNAEALDFLQTAFSSPTIKPKKKRSFVYAGASCLCLAALVAAYVLGARSSRVVYSKVNTAGFTEPDRGDRALLLNSAMRKGPTAPAKLRLNPSGAGLSGNVVVVNPLRKGSLSVDGDPLARGLNGKASACLTAGAHRIEWFDSTMQRGFGETVELLPFETKTISLARFFHGK